MCAVLFASNLIKTLEKCVVLFISNSLKKSVLFDVSSGKVYNIVCLNSLERSVLFDVWKSV